MEDMIVPKEANSIMYQDYTARRPMEIETYLGAPVKLAKEAGVRTPRVETLYTLLHHINIANQKKALEAPPPTPSAAAAPRAQAPPTPRAGPPPMGAPMNGPPPHMRPRGGSRAPSMTGPPPPHMRRGPPSGQNGYPPPGPGMPPRGPPMQRRPSFEGNGLDEFSHLVMYDTPESGDGYSPGQPSDLAMRERELMLRQKEIGRAHV